jgi:exosortase A-associated hydrolase 1
MRRVIAFDCAGDALIGTLDEGVAATGLLIVTGGNEVRAGAHRGMAMLAARLAADGVPVFRFDRRGVGDSEGVNTGYEGSRDDLIAAAAAFRREAVTLRRIVGFGNCDAASALALFGRDAGVDALVLANPWLVEETDDLPPASAIRHRYVERALSPRAWGRLISGQIDFRKLYGGLLKLVQPRPQGLADRVVSAIAGWGDDARIVLARRDNTAVAFADAAAARDLPTRIEFIDTGSHSFAREQDAAALEAAIRSALQ